MGKGDPTTLLEAQRYVAARHFRSGEATLEVRATERSLVIRTWGSGAEEALEMADTMLGLHDTPVFDFGESRVNHLVRPVANLRLARAPSLPHVLVNVVLQQQIAWRDAAQIWRRLCLGYGGDAPGPYRLKLPPSFTQLRRISLHDYQRAGLSRRRAGLLHEIARLGHRIDDWYAESRETYVQKVQTLPLVGPWTTYFPLAIGMGEPDIVILGDYALPHTVSWALTGQARSNDAEMLQLLAPFKGNRWRLVRLLWALNITAPRRGARMPKPPERR